MYCSACRHARIRAREVVEKAAHEARLTFQRTTWAHGRDRGIPEKFWGDSFDTFDPVGNEAVVQELRAYAEAFQVDARPKGAKSLLITRDVNGVGKTHLACAVLRTIIEKFEKVDWDVSPYQFWTAGKLKQRIRGGQRFGGAESEADVYKDFGSMWLLVLDDIGKEPLTGADAAATYEMYYTVINERYNSALPMVITSNLGFKPWAPGGLSIADLIGKAGASRLMEMTGGTEYIIAGQDRR
jgi:DNA replication protein DnaC